MSYKGRVAKHKLEVKKAALCEATQVMNRVARHKLEFKTAFFCETTVRTELPNKTKHKDVVIIVSYESHHEGTGLSNMNQK